MCLCLCESVWMSAGRRFPFFSLFKSFNRHILEPPASQNNCRFLKTSTEKWQMIYCLQLCYNNEKVYFSLIYRPVEMATLFWRWNENRTVCFVLSKLAKIAVFPDSIEFIAQQSAADILHCQLIQFAFIWNQYLNNLQESTQNFRLKSSFFWQYFSNSRRYEMQRQCYWSVSGSLKSYEIGKCSQSEKRPVDAFKILMNYCSWR